MKIDVLYNDKNLIAVRKPIGVPTQPDPSGDGDLMSAAKAHLADIGERGELWLVHRLDRVVGGVVIFAKNKKYAALLSAMVSERDMQKEYFAVVEGSASGGVMQDYLYKDAAKGKAFAVKTERRGVKFAELEYEPICEKNTERGACTLVEVKLHTGRFHQIRVQFASRGMPLIGDGKYGSRDKGSPTPALYAVRLEFRCGGKDFSVSALPPIDAYPWSLFALEIQAFLEENK